MNERILCDFIVFIRIYFRKSKIFCNMYQTEEGKKCVFFLKRKNEPVKSDLFLEKAYEIYKQRARRLM